MSPREYRQRFRAESAEETRRRILDAVRERLTKAPSEPVSLERVASLAGVSRSTVYLTFGSRAGLFDALADDLRERGGFHRIAAAMEHPDARESLRGVIDASVPVFAANRTVLRALYSMAQLDSDAVGGAVRRMGEARAAGLATLALRLEEQGALRGDLTVEDATHLLWSVTGFEYFDLLRTGRDLTVAAVTALIRAAAERLILTDSSGPS